MKNTIKQPRKQLFRKPNISLDVKTKHAKLKGVNGSTSNDRLDLLIKGYEQQIRAKEGELLTWKAKLQTAVELARESENFRVAETPGDKYSEAGTTEAVFDAIACLWRDGKGTARGVIAAQIRDFILAHGFNPKCEPSNFSTAIGVTLNRLTSGKRIICVEFGGKNYYRPLDAYKEDFGTGGEAGEPKR
jgi:hypothetical protein